MNYKKDSSNKEGVRGITVKIERRNRAPASLAKPSFFDALQHVSSPFERKPSRIQLIKIFHYVN